MDHAIITANRRHLDTISRWIDDEAYANSRCYYGCPPRLRHVVDLPINDDVTYTDLLVQAARHLGAPLHYLEVGVSLGKNFYVLARALEGAHLFGLDWERINPVLEARLEPLAVEERARRYALGPNRITYLQGDLFRLEDWRTLEGVRFQLAFFDAIDRAEALLFEVDRMLELGLIDPHRFFLLWDDLDADADGATTRAFHHAAERIQRELGAPSDGLFRLTVNGSLGQHEPPHFLGVVNNVGLTRDSFAGSRV